MKKKSLFLLVISILIFFITHESGSEQKPEWRGKIEYEDGVKVIKNPREPLYGEIKLDLKEDLSIGREDAENYMFYRARGIAVDSQENIFVLDGGNHRIQKFDRNGNYLQTIGRKGQGPGEFEQPSDIYLNSKGQIYVKDGRKVHIFDKNGEFERNIALNFYIGSYGITEEGNILADAFSFSGPPEEQTFDIVLVNPEGKKLKAIACFPSQMVILRKEGIMAGGNHPYTPILRFCPLDDKSGVYGYSSEYRLFVIDSSGDTLYIIEKNEPGAPITGEEKDKIINDAFERWNRRRQQWSKGEIKRAHKFNKYRPFYTRIIKDDRGNIYVAKQKSIFNDEKWKDFDLFNKEGYYLYKVTIPFYPNLIKSGNIYRISSDEDTGEIRAVRYKIKNWAQIKEGI